jgi:hypothetical protein
MSFPSSAATCGVCYGARESYGNRRLWGQSYQEYRRERAAKRVAAQNGEIDRYFKYPAGSLPEPLLNRNFCLRYRGRPGYSCPVEGTLMHAALHNRLASLPHELVQMYPELAWTEDSVRRTPVQLMQELYLKFKVSSIKSAGSSVVDDNDNDMGSPDATPLAICADGGLETVAFCHRALLQRMDALWRRTVIEQWTQVSAIAHEYPNFVPPPMILAYAATFLEWRIPITRIFGPRTVLASTGGCVGRMAAQLRATEELAPHEKQVKQQAEEECGERIEWDVSLPGSEDDDDDDEDDDPEAAEFRTLMARRRRPRAPRILPPKQRGWQAPCALTNAIGVPLSAEITSGIWDPCGSSVPDHMFLCPVCGPGSTLIPQIYQEDHRRAFHPNTTRDEYETAIRLLCWICPRCNERNWGSSTCSRCIYAQSAKQQTTWGCSVCTFVNQPENGECVICLAGQRPSSGSVKVPAISTVVRCARCHAIRFWDSNKSDPLCESCRDEGRAALGSTWTWTCDGCGHTNRKRGRTLYDVNDFCDDCLKIRTPPAGAGLPPRAPAGRDQKGWDPERGLRVGDHGRFVRDPPGPPGHRPSATDPAPTEPTHLELDLTQNRLAPSADFVRPTESAPPAAPPSSTADMDEKRPLTASEELGLNGAPKPFHRPAGASIEIASGGGRYLSGEVPVDRKSAAMHAETIPCDYPMCGMQVPVHEYSSHLFAHEDRGHWTKRRSNTATLLSYKRSAPHSDGPS